MRDFPANVLLSRDEALAIGWSDSALSRAARRGDIARVRRGYFARPPVTPLLAAEAACRACTGSAISHRSAALVHSVPLLGGDPVVPELSVEPTNGTTIVGAHIHRATLEPLDVVSTPAGLATSVGRTVIDLGRRYGTKSMVVAADAALHAHRIRPQDLEDVAVRCWNWPGIRRATSGLHLVDKRAESPLESVSRLAIRSMPIPQPVPQVQILGPTGRPIGRVDFYWDEFGVAGEADGLLKYRDAGALTTEKLRQERLEELGVLVVRWGWDEVTRVPTVLEARLRRAFDRSAALRRSGFVPEWSARVT